MSKPLSPGNPFAPKAPRRTPSPGNPFLAGRAEPAPPEPPKRAGLGQALADTYRSVAGAAVNPLREPMQAIAEDPAAAARSATNVGRAAVKGAAEGAINLGVDMPAGATEMLATAPTPSGTLAKAARAGLRPLAERAERAKQALGEMLLTDEQRERFGQPIVGRTEDGGIDWSNPIDRVPGLDEIAGTGTQSLVITLPMLAAGGPAIQALQGLGVPLRAAQMVAYGGANAATNATLQQQDTMREGRAELASRFAPTLDIGDGQQRPLGLPPKAQEQATRWSDDIAMKTAGITGAFSGITGALGAGLMNTQQAKSVGEAIIRGALADLPFEMAEEVQQSITADILRGDPADWAEAADAAIMAAAAAATQGGSIGAAEYAAGRGGGAAPPAGRAPRPGAPRVPDLVPEPAPLDVSPALIADTGVRMARAANGDLIIDATPTDRPNEPRLVGRQDPAITPTFGQAPPARPRRAGMAPAAPQIAAGAPQVPPAAPQPPAAAAPAAPARTARAGVPAPPAPPATPESIQKNLLNRHRVSGQWPAPKLVAGAFGIPLEEARAAIKQAAATVKAQRAEAAPVPTPTKEQSNAEAVQQQEVGPEAPVQAEPVAGAPEGGGEAGVRLQSEQDAAQPVAPKRAGVPAKKAKPAKKPAAESAAERAVERETITPAEDTIIGKNDAGETLYDRKDGSRYRMRFDRADKPNGYPDFGGDLVPVGDAAAEETPPAQTVRVFQTKREAMNAGDQSGRGWTVEPVGERDPALPWRLILDADPQPVEAAATSAAPQTVEAVAAKVDDAASDARRIYREAYEKNFPGRSLSEDMTDRSADEVARMIANKDADGLRSRNLGNPKFAPSARAVFEALTGVKLPRARNAAEAAIDKWAGVTPEERQRRTAERKAAIEQQKANRENSASRARASRVEVNVADTEQKMTGAEYVDDLIARGFTRAVTRGPKTYLVNAAGDGFAIPNKDMAAYARAQSRGASSQAPVAEPPASTTSTAEPQGAKQEPQDAPEQAQAIEGDAITAARRDSFEHAGSLIYPSAGKWLIQSPENRGTNRTFGDTIWNSAEEAKSEAERIAANAESKKKRQELEAQKESERQSARESDPVVQFAKTRATPMLAARAEAALRKPVRNNGRFISVADLVREKVDAGASIQTREGQDAIVESDGSYLLQKQVGVFGMSFAKSLVERRAASSAGDLIPVALEAAAGPEPRAAATEAGRGKPSAPAPAAEPDALGRKTLDEMLSEAGTQGVWLGRMTQADGPSVDVKVIRWPTQNRATWGIEWHHSGKKEGGLPFPAIKSGMTAKQIADTFIDYMNVDSQNSFAMDQIGEKHARLIEQRSTLDQRKQDAEMAAMRKARGDTEVRPWDQTDLETKRQIDRISANRFKTASDERMLELLTARLQSRPDKWKVGDGVSYKVNAGGVGMQTNRGFRIVAKDDAAKTVTLRSVADTGLTSSGGNNDRIGDVEMHVGNLRRDRNYDAAEPPAAEPTPSRVEAAAAEAATSPPAAAEDGGKAAQRKIEDVGEKIGGARKDLAPPTGSARKKSDDPRPAWARRFEISQVVTPGGMIGAIKDAGKWIIRDTKSTGFAGQFRQVGSAFDSKEEAEAFVPIAAVGLKHRPVPASRKEGEPTKYEIWREISDRKRVKVVDQEFDTRDDAMRYMAENAIAILETNTTFGEADIPLPPNRERRGPAKRTGNVTGEDFKEVFGFRGVEFGEWNNQDERQALLNDAWDGLMDLADVLGIPPRAISLGGDLALAFGARGHGLQSARAHYETDRAVINLTKERGAGSLAHEWFHALDHYFGRQDGKASAKWEVQPDGTRILKVGSADRAFASSGFSGNRSGVRPEVRAAYEAILKTMATKAQTYVQDMAQVDKFTGAAREDLARELDALRRDLSEQKDRAYWKRNHAPASAEQLAEFDRIAKAMLDGDVLAITVDWRTIENKSKRLGADSRWTNDSLEQLSAIYKAVRGRSGFDGANQRGVLDKLRGSMTRYSQRLKMLADAQAGTEKTKNVPTDFAMNARELDQGRGSDYWTSPHEMAARAFQGYVEDKIAERGGVSRFLNYGPENVGILTPWGFKRPFPAGTERQAINAAFDQFFKTIETRTDDAGNVGFFSLPSTPAAPGKRPAPAAIKGMAARAASTFGVTINVVPNTSHPSVPERVRGTNPTANGYTDGFQAWVFTDNIVSLPHAAAVIAHEVVGHVGVEAITGEAEWQGIEDTVRGVLDGTIAANDNDADASNRAGAFSRARPTAVTQEVARIIREARQRYPGASDRLLAKESVAIMAERGVKASMLDRILAALRRGLRRMFPSIAFTDAELRDLIARSSETLRSGARAESAGEKQALFSQALPLDSPEFRAWFGDSKVVDEDGRPLVVYHGTSLKNLQGILKKGLVPKRKKNHKESGDYVYVELSAKSARAWARQAGGTEFAVLEIEVPKSQLVRDSQTLSRTSFRTQRIPARLIKGWDVYRIDPRTGDLEYVRSESNPAFSPEQIKSAIGNVGAFGQRPVTAAEAAPLGLTAEEANEAQARGDIRFAQGTPDPSTPEGARAAMEAIGEAVRRAPVLDRTKAKEIFDRQMARAKRAKINAVTGTRPARYLLLPRFWIVEFGKRLVPKAEAFMRLANRMEAEANAAGQAADEQIANPWANLYSRVQTVDAAGNRDMKARAQSREAQADLLADIMNRATVSEFDPDPALPLRRVPTTLAHRQLVNDFARLDPDVQQLYRNIREHYRQQRIAYMNALQEMIAKSIQDKAIRREMLAKLKVEFESKKVPEPYFPLTRFGDYWVAATKRQDGTKVPESQRPFEMADTPAEQERIREELERAGWVVEVGAKFDRGAREAGSSSLFLSDLMRMLDERGDADATFGAHVDMLKDAIYQLHLQHLPELSHRKRFIHRTKRPGWSRDALRAFAQHSSRAGRQVAKLRYGWQLAKTLEDARAEAPQSEDPVQAAQIINALEDNYQWTMNPNRSQWSVNATQFGFIWYLGLTVAAGMINFGQYALFTVPRFMAKYSTSVLQDGKVLDAAFKAADDYINSMFSRDARKKLEAEFDGDMGRALKELEESGDIDRTQTLDLSGLAESDASYSLLGRRVVYGAGFMFHHVERLNREATAIAAYRLERARGASHENAVLEAKSDIHWTHYNYSSSNRAKWMRGNWMPIITLFKQYALNVTVMFARLIQLAFGGDRATAEQKRIARKQLTYMLGFQFMAAGAYGMPIFKESMVALTMFMSMLGGDDEDPWDAELEFRSMLADLLSEKGGEVVAKGWVNAMLGLELSGRISMSELWWRASDTELQGPAAQLHTIEQLLGPVLSLPLVQVPQALNLMAQGEWQRGAEGLMPKFMRDIARTERYMTEGLRAIGGEQIIDEFTAIELVYQTLGFSPARVGEIYDERNAMKRVEQRTMTARQRILADLWRATQAVSRGEPDAAKQVREVHARIEAWNRANPDWPLTHDGIRQSMRARASSQARSFRGTQITPELMQRMEDKRFAESKTER